MHTHVQPFPVHGASGTPHTHGQTPQPHWNVSAPPPPVLTPQQELEHLWATRGKDLVTTASPSVPDASAPAALAPAPAQPVAAPSHDGANGSADAVDAATPIVPALNSVEAQRALTENHVVQPPESAEALQVTSDEYIVIDSNDRNRVDHPEPNRYMIALGAEYRDVKELTLISHCVPSPQHPVRDSNRALHFTSTDPIVTRLDGGAEADAQQTTVVVQYSDEQAAGAFNAVSGTYSIDYSTSIAQQSVAIPRGYYEEGVFDHDTAVGLQQDALAKKLEEQLHAEHVACTMTFDPQSLQYTLRTTFANPYDAFGEAGDPSPGNPYDAPRFLSLLFRGADTFYGETSIERTNVSGDPDAPVYQTTKIGKQQRNYIEGSLGPVIGFPTTDPVHRLTGTVYSDAVDNLTLRGNGTAFLRELQVGDWVYVLDLVTPENKYRVQIKEVTSDTECALEAVSEVAPPTIAPSLAWTGRFTAPYARNLAPDCYMVLKIEQCETLQSMNNTINRGFMILPTQPNRFQDTDPIVPQKRFNPTRGRLEQLQLSFHNTDGSLYDFMGQNHLLVFRLVRYKQNVNYSHF